MKYLSRILVLAAVVLGFASCNNDADVDGPDGLQPGDMSVNINFSFADKARQTRSKVSGTENVVHVMQMVCFDANGQYLGIRNADVTSNGASGTFFDTGVVKGTVPQGTARIHFIANRNLTVPLSFSNGTAEETVMNSEELSTLYNDEAHQEVCYWGYHKENSADEMNTWLNSPEGTNNTVYLIRDRAKVVLTYDPTGASFPVTKIEWLIHNGRDRGYIAPKSSDWNSYTTEGSTGILISGAGMNEYTASGRYSLWTSETENDDDKFDVAYQSTGTYTSQPQFLFDDDNTDIDDVKIILRVTYTVDGSSKTVYHVLKLNDDNKVKYDIVRNNTYYIECKLLSPDIAYYETLKAAINGDEFVNADMDLDRSIPDINDENNTLQIKLPTETTSIVLNTESTYNLDFVFRTISDVNVSGSTDPDDFNVYWEKTPTFCSADLPVTYVSGTQQFQIQCTVTDLTDQLQDEWIVVEHKDGLKRYIHVYVIDQFRYLTAPTLTAVGSDYVLSFQLPPMEHSNPDNPDLTEAIYPESLYPIDIKFATNTLNAYGLTQGTTNYGLFGVAVESTSGLVTIENFEDDYNSPISSTNYNSDRTHWYYQQGGNFWDFWYTYNLKANEYPEDGIVNIYFKDVRDNIKYATVADVGLFLYVEYFGKIYSVPVTTN